MHEGAAADLTAQMVGGAFIAGVPLDWSDEAKQEWLREAADMGADRTSGYCVFDDYYVGEQRTRLLQRQKEYLEQSGIPWCENYCETIVDFLTEQMEVEAFQVDGNDAASKWFNDVAWKRNQMDEVQGVVHHELFKLGDAFAMVDFDEETGLPCYRRKDPWRTKPVYGEDDELLYMVFVWDSLRSSPTNPDGTPIRRMNLYFPGHVEKWFALGQDADTKSVWAPHLDDGDYEDVEQYDEETGELMLVHDEQTGEEVPLLLPEPVWPTPWTMDGTPEGEPIGIAIVHFANKANGKHMGRSELRGLIPQQDALTKDLLDLFDVMDYQGWPQRWVSGVNDTTALKVKPGEFLKLPDEASAGQFDPADPGPLNDGIEKRLGRMGSRSRVPVHILLSGGAGSLPSGETLKTAYAPATKLAKNRATPWGNRWARLQMLGYRVTVAFGGDLSVSMEKPAEPPAPDEAPPKPEDVVKDTLTRAVQRPAAPAPEPEFEDVTVELAPDEVIDVLWVNPEPRNEESEATTYESRIRSGLSKRTALREMGYDADEELAQSRDEAEVSAEAAIDAFNKGAVPGVGPGLDVKPGGVKPPKEA